MNTTEREPVDPPLVHALVVYESMFGNTAAIARAIADGLCSRLDVEIVEVSKAPTRLGEIDLVVAGGPTHVFGLSRPSTRRSAGSRLRRASCRRASGSASGSPRYSTAPAGR